jgi:hypothetical protein
MQQQFDHKKKPSLGGFLFLCKNFHFPLFGKRVILMLNMGHYALKSNVFKKDM